MPQPCRVLVSCSFDGKRSQSLRVGSTAFELLFLFSTKRSPEDNPRRKIRREVFEAVFDVCGYEECVACMKPAAFSVENELSFACMDEIQLILRMRCLWIVTDRSIQLDVHRPVRHGAHKAFALGPLRSDWSGES